MGLACHQMFTEGKEELLAAKEGPLQTEMKGKQGGGGVRGSTLFQNSNRAATVGKKACCQTSNEGVTTCVSENRV